MSHVLPRIEGFVTRSWFQAPLRPLIEGVGDRNMAQAAFNALTLDEQKNNTIPVKKAEYDRDLDDSYNRYFSRIMNIYCPPNAGEKNK